MNIAIYARVSTTIQAEQGYSLASQVSDCRKKAEELGATYIQDFVDDGYSGAYFERPALSRLRESVKQGLFDVIICYDPDRLARKLSGQLILTEEFEKHARLVFVNMDYKTTPEGQLYYNIRGAFADFEREKIRERSMRGRRAKLMQGKVIQDSHIYGYDFVKETSSYKINEYEADMIRLVFSIYINESGGYRKVAEKLNSLGKIHSQSHPKWVSSMIAQIISNPIYTGTYYSQRFYHKKTGITKEERIDRPREEWIEMRSPVIVDEDTFDSAQYKRFNSRKFRSNRENRNALLRGLAVCGFCGHSLRIQATPQGDTLYGCINKLASREVQCDSRAAYAKIVDEAFWTILKGICQDEKSIESYTNKMDSRPDNIDVLSSLLEQVSKIKAERNVVMSWFSDGVISQEEATSRLHDLKKREVAAIQKIDEEKSLGNSRNFFNPADIKNQVSNCDEDFETKRKVCLSIIDKVIFKRLDKSWRRSSYALDFEIFFKK